MRVLLVTGKGGVGTTTVAAATAVHAARCGIKTLVVAAGPAHSLADCLAWRLGPQPVEVLGGLHAAEVDLCGRRELAWDRVADLVPGLLDEAGIDPFGADELAELPGAADVQGLLAVGGLVAGADHDLVVVDCGAAPGALRALALPDAVRACAELVLPPARRVARAIATGARATREATGPPRDLLVEAVERLVAELAAVRELVAGPSASVRLVVTPETVVLSEARRTLTALALLGYAVDRVVVNRVVPDGVPGSWQAGLARSQAALLARFGAELEVVAPGPPARAGYAPCEPVGVAALVELGEDLYGRPDEAAATALLAPPDVERMRVERSGEHFVLVLPLPLAAREDVDLARAGDDLSVTVDGRRRLVPLPSALRRCLVDGASLEDGRLRVRFRPDPALWPRR